MNKICYLNLVTYSNTGGIENFNRTFLNVLSSSFNRVTSVSVYDNKLKQEFENIDYMNFSNNKLKVLLYIIKNIYKIDKLIVAHVNLMPIVIIAKCLNPKLEVYLSIYGIEVWKKLPYMYRIFMKKINILSISSYTTDTFIKYNKIPRANIFYMGSNIYNKNLNKLDFVNPYNKKEFNILSVTRLTQIDNYKGVIIDSYNDDNVIALFESSKAKNLKESLEALISFLLVENGFMTALSYLVVCGCRLSFLGIDR